MGRIQRRIVRGVLGVVGRPKLTLVVAGAVLLACAAWAYFRLEISTDTNKLFSERVPFFADYLAFDRKFPENEAVYVVVEATAPAHTPPTARWTAAADAIAGRLRAIPQHVRSVHARVPIEKLGDQGLLFEDPARVAAAADEMRRFAQLIQVVAERPPALQRLVLGPTPLD